MKNLTLQAPVSPHIAGALTVPVAMRDVVIALLPITAVGLSVYGVPALFNLALCLVTCAVTQRLARMACGRVGGLGDGSVWVTGLLLALLLPPASPWWMPVIGSVLAIGVAKELAGGLGWNYFNPALFGRAMLILLAQPLARLGSGTATALTGLDSLTSATPMAAAQAAKTGLPAYGELLLRYPGGSMAETSALTLLIGGMYLMWRGHVPLRIPGAMIGTVVVMSLLAGRDPIFHVLAGGLMIGAFFMATDWVTRPVTPNGMLVFGIGAGLLVAVFRFWMPPPEGVAFAILIMNPTVRWLEKTMKPVW
jgi:electron transport complex protein RnfD